MMIKRILWGLVAVGLLAAIVSGWHRRRTEQENRSVEIALDYGELRSLAGSEGVPLRSVLQRFRQVGATSVIVQEDTVGALEEARRVSVRALAESGTDSQTLLTPLVDGPGGDALITRISDVLHHKTRLNAIEMGGGANAEGSVNAGGGNTKELRINAPYSVVRGVGLGLDPDLTREIKSAGLRIVGRVSNYNNAQPAQIDWILGELKKQGVSTVLFSGDDVLGYKGFVTAPKVTSGDRSGSDDGGDSSGVSTESSLRAHAIDYATVEFGKQKGDPELTRALADRVVRLHTVLGTEMATADIPGNIQRFNLAARERNIRMLFVRLFLGEEQPLQTNSDYVLKITKGIALGGLVVGPSHGYGPLKTSALLRFFIGIGLASAFLLLIDSITGFFSGVGLGGPLALLLLRVVAWGGAALLIVLPLLPFGGFFCVKLAALACAFVFPPLGLLHSDKLRPDRTTKVPVLVALLRFLAATAITAIGAAYVVGLLSDRLFLIKADAFLGVKVSELIPVLIIGLVYALRLRASGKRPWATALEQTRKSLTDFLGEPIRWWQVAAAIVVLGVLVVLVMRSGNDPGIGVSALELKFRALLDRVLPARPRNKALICHPLLLVGLILAVRGRRKWALPLVLAGAIGQADLLNTFCHIHTALPGSIARALLGLLFGILIGLFAYWMLDRLILRRFPDVPAPAFGHAASAENPAL